MTIAASAITAVFIHPIHRRPSMDAESSHDLAIYPSSALWRP
jgi:hypothetical protein